MKAKYARKKNFKNASETFIYNTDKYCEIIAKKFGKDEKEAKEYFEKFFKFLDDRKLLTNAVKVRLNQNIKTFILNFIGTEDMPNPRFAAFYSPADNSITLNKKDNYRQSNFFIHEFIHLLTASCNVVDKNKLTKVLPVNKKAVNIVAKTGFDHTEFSFPIVNYSIMAQNFNEEEAKQFLASSLQFITPEQFAEAADWFSDATGKNCMRFNSLIFDPNKSTGQTYSTPSSREKERQEKRELAYERREEEKERDIQRRLDRETKEIERSLTEYYPTNFSLLNSIDEGGDKFEDEVFELFNELFEGQLEEVAPQQNSTYKRALTTDELILQDIVENFVEKPNGRFDDKLSKKYQFNLTENRTKTEATAKDITAKRKAKARKINAEAKTKKVEEQRKKQINFIAQDFITKNSYLPYEIYLPVNTNKVVGISHNGKGKYYAETYTLESSLDFGKHGFPGRNFNEGMTEFLARYFSSCECNANYLSSCGYDIFVKYVEMLYKIYGDALLETFFDQSKENLMRLTDSSEEQVNALFENIDNLFNFLGKGEIASYKECHKQIMLFIYEKLTTELTMKVLYDLPAYNDVKEIDHCVKQSLFEFSKSLYFGFEKNLLQGTRVEMMTELANVYGDIMFTLKVLGCELEDEDISITELREELISYFGEEEVSKLANVKLPNDNTLENFYSDANFACDNSYFFTNKDLKEIRPTDYVNNKTITTYNNNNQEYLRKKAKFPTTYQIHLTHHIREF